MSHRKFLSFTHYVMLLLLFNSLSNGLIAQQTKCPNLEDLLNKGYSMHGVDSHTPGTAGNNDEFGIYDTNPFYIKVGNYPPIRAFYKDFPCGSLGYYMSFDLDIINPAPIPYTVTYNSPNKVYTYGTNGIGWQFEVIPPDNDFVSTFEGNEYDKSDGTPPWGEIVNPNLIEPYIAEPSVSIIVSSYEMAINSNQELIADIYGGDGDYSIVWERQDATGSWSEIENKSNDQAKDWFTINNINYYFYSDEYKCNIQMGVDDITLRVSVGFFKSDPLKAQTITSSPITIHPAPISIRFNNKIGTIENYGQLILDEIKTDPINSGDSRPLAFGTTHIVRTNELPFIINWQNTGKTEKHQYWALNDPLNLLNYSFDVTPDIIRDLKANFIPTDPVRVRNVIEGVELSGSTVDLRDPWYYQEDTSSHNWSQPNSFTSYNSPFEILNNSPTTYGGVFLGQEIAANKPYYSVKAQQTQNMTLGNPWGTRPAYFLNWSGTNVDFEDANLLETPVVFNLAGAIATANYKGHFLSNSTTTYANNSQRKIVRDDNGYYHMVYHSLGKIWYTKSTTTTFNGSWAQETQIEIGETYSNPSLDYHNGKIAVVFESQGEGTAAIQAVIIDAVKAG